MMIGLLFGCSTFFSPKPKTIVLVVADTFRADRLGVYGNPRVATPSLDAIAREGTYFTRAYAHSGWTLPSFVSLFTGLYPHEHRVIRNPAEKEMFGALTAEHQTLAEELKKSGYRTAAIMNNTFLAPPFGLNQGFDNYDYEGADNTNFRSALLTSELALSWLKESDEAAFVVVHYMEPHMHLEPPKELRGTFLPEGKLSIPFTTKEAFGYTTDPQRLSKDFIQDVLALYDEEIFAVDQAVGALVDGLKEQGRWDNTLFVFTSDHGEEFWEHGHFEHGHSLMSVLTRVPLILKGPGIAAHGEREILVEHVDLFHTLLKQGGAEAPSQARGEDLLKLSVENEAVERWSVSENTLYGDSMISLVTPHHRLVVNQKNKVARVWSIDEQGLEVQLVPDSEQSKLALPLLSGLKGVRGDLNPIEEVSGISLPSQKAFQQLKSLGYLEE